MTLLVDLQDVKFGAANLPAMNFMGGGAKNGQQWLEFLGEVKDKRVPPVGSPFQQNFNPTGNNTPPGITPAVGKMASCGDPLFLCSCADCPVAPGCSIVSDMVIIITTVLLMHLAWGVASSAVRSCIHYIQTLSPVMLQ